MEPLEQDGALQLVRTDAGLALTDGDLSVTGDFSRMLPRLRPDVLNRELLVRAAKLKGENHPRALDATAGLGEDALLLAAAGFSVRLFESNPTIAALLEDAMTRAKHVADLAEIVGRMSLTCGDSVAAMQALAKAGAAQDPPDVIVLDPMFPGKHKSAKVKKKLQLLQRLELPCEDEEALLEAAIAAHPRKIVIKRPAKGPYLAGRAPDYSIAGKAIRYDCIALPR